jgi:hypothetical protein
MKTDAVATPEQLQLDLPLRQSSLPVQFRLDQRTRQRGLAHIAEIREMLGRHHAALGATEAA